VIPSTQPERSAVWHRAFAIPTEPHGAALHDLPISCVALQGSHDLLVPSSTLPLLAKALPPGSATHIIRGAGHVPYLTHVEECVRLLRPWIESLVGARDEAAA
jgi:pimeloyl-ACP methyl ester carboxylesterase